MPLFPLFCVPVFRFTVFLLGPLLALAGSLARAGQFEIKGPPGSARFGTQVTVLPNGNLVVTDPGFAAPGPIANAGAVYLYSSSGVRISTLTGSHAEDQVGNGGVRVLAGGDYVVISQGWNRERGAVTWGHRDSGVSGVVSAENSLTGTRLGDMVGDAAGEGMGAGVVALRNGHYVVRSRKWSNGTKLRTGAVTWGNGTIGTSGAISSANSLVGTTDEDQVGAVTALTNGDFVVSCPQWDNGSLKDVGAVVWCSGTSGRSGPVSVDNALVGTLQQNRVGDAALSYGGPVVELTNGNYVVVSPRWSDATMVARGAVTWCPSNGGLTGPVSGDNSLIGSSLGDTAGGGGTAPGTTHRVTGGVIPLSDGNYVVSSPLWDKPGMENAGAVTWCDGNAGTKGPISAAVSLTGSVAGDCIGGGGLAALANGHYVVSSPLWNRLMEFESGAATRVVGGGPFNGVVSAGNSLTATGLEAYLTVLANGHYVVSSPMWHNTPQAFRAGAVTWCDGNTGRIGAVSAANSLVGTSLDDHVGAITLEGSTKRSGIVALPNGHYVVRSTLWKNGEIPQAGAVTWCNGTTGRTGPVDTANSLTGSSVQDWVGGVTVLQDGNYLVVSPYWDRNGIVNAGAVTWCDGTSARAGQISNANSLTGQSENDLIGRDGVEAMKGGHYGFASRNWNTPEPDQTGAVTFGRSGGSTIGFIDSTNSVLGTGYSYVAAPSYGVSDSGAFLAAGRPRSNSVVVFSYDPANPAENPGPFGATGGSPKAEWFPDGKVSLSFQTIPGATYLLQSSPDLTAWTAGVPVTADAEGRILTVLENQVPGKSYYRLKVP